MFERELRDLSFVKRWSIARTIAEQTVAEHSFFVAIYVQQILKFFGSEDKHYILIDALWHDVEESFTGDIPGPVKRHTVNIDDFNKLVDEGMMNRFGFVPQYTDYTSKIVIKVANLLDEVFYLASERQMGNMTVLPIYHKSFDRLTTAIERLKSEWDEEKVNEFRVLVWDSLQNHFHGTSEIVECDTDIGENNGKDDTRTEEESNPQTVQNDQTS